MEKISVYIPCYNAENFIVGAVRSVLGQTLFPDEVLVIDDGCTDRSIEFITSFSVRVVKMGSNQGLAAARNLAFKEARNELIASIDADCEASPTWLEELVSGLPEECVGSGGRIIETNRIHPADRWRAEHMSAHWGDKSFINPKVIFGANQLFRKSAVFEVGLFDTTKVVDDYKIGIEDYEITQKMYQSGYKLFYNPKAIVYHLTQNTPASIIRQYWRWSVFYYPPPNTWIRLLLKIGINFFKSIKHIGDDIPRKDPRLITISFRIFPYHTYYDLQYLRQKSRKAKND